VRFQRTIRVIWSETEHLGPVCVWEEITGLFDTVELLVLWLAGYDKTYCKECKGFLNDGLQKIKGVGS